VQRDTLSFCLCAFASGSITDVFIGWQNDMSILPCRKGCFRQTAAVGLGLLLFWSAIGSYAFYNTTISIDERGNSVRTSVVKAWPHPSAPHDTYHVHPSFRPLRNVSRPSWKTFSTHHNGRT
jgi:hypothetical protein